MLSIHYNGSNSFLFVNATKIYQFEAKDSEIKDYALYQGNISKDFTINNMKETGLKEFLKVFSVDFNSINTNDLLDIRKYLMKRTEYQIMFGLIKKIVNGLLTGLGNGYYHTKWVLLSNQECLIELTLLIYVLLNTVKNFTTIHLRLN